MSRLLSLLGPVLLVTTACSGGPAPVPPSAGPPDPRAFAAEAAEVPMGFREALCPDLREGGSGLTVRLVVPVAMTTARLTDGTCTFGRGLVRDLSVRIGPEETLADWRREELDPFEDIGGDDEVSDIAYRSDVPGLAGRPAEELTYRVYNDGLPFWTVVLQSGGLRLQWSIPDGRAHQLDAFDAVRRSVAVSAGTEARCPSWGPPERPTVSFTPPPGTDWVEREGDHCRIYLDDATTLLEYAAVHPSPGPLERLAARVRADPEVVRVRLQRNAGRIAGEPADRLTWVVERAEETESYEPAGTWRIEVLQSASARVEWGATPRWWREHRASYDDLVGSVAVVR